MILVKKPLAALFLGLALFAPAAAAEGQPANISFEGRYAVIARGMEAGVFNVRFNQTGSAYQINADRRMTGMVGALLNNNQDYTYSVTGSVAEDGSLRPVNYQHQGGRRREDRPNGRLVRAAFTANDVVTTTVPAGMGMGSPPATAEQKRGVVDQLTAIATLVTASGNPCDRTVRVYMDGRSRFDFVLTPNGTVNANTPGYNGQALRCSVAFRPIAGFSDPIDPATMTFLFARSPSGLYAPVQIEMPADGVGIVRLQARSLRLNGAAL
ncbi:MAG: DUF3108 domain-containing protein [Hyphomonadaceae bacterium]|nr:DUF3108 domain-containing protein [Hyphomonadaceae bacterium]